MGPLPTPAPCPSTSQERILRLSQPLLDLLHEWSGRPAASQEERTLAQQLHEDFSRYVVGPHINACTYQAHVAHHMHVQRKVTQARCASTRLLALPSPPALRSLARFPPAAGEVPQLGSALEETTLGEGEDDLGLRVVHDRTLLVHAGPSEQERLRLAGNEAYKAGDLTLAIRCYSQALDVLVPGMQVPVGCQAKE